MTLITCPECGKKISDMAQNCPNCGRPMNFKNSDALKQKPAENFSEKPNVVPTAKKKKKGHGCLITFLIIILFFAALIQILVSQAPNNSSKHIISNYIDVTDEQGAAIDDILHECGIETFISFEHDELLDNAHIEGETGYRAAINENVDNIIVYLTQDMSVYRIVYAGYDLYLDGAVVSTIQDYTMTADEKSDLMIKCEEIIKDILVSPSTAKFPNILEWKFGKEKNIVIIQGYVDSQNGFGAEIRSDFQFTVNTDTNNVESLIFDGQELITE